MLQCIGEVLGGAIAPTKVQVAHRNLVFTIQMHLASPTTSITLK